MKADLRTQRPRRTRKRVMYLFALLFFLRWPSLAAAQTSCAMEKDIVESWTSTVEADKKDIAKLEHTQGSSQQTKLQAKLRKDNQRLQDAQIRFTTCRSRANSGMSSTVTTVTTTPVALMDASAKEFEIQGLGRLSFGKLDLHEQQIGAKLVLETNQFEGLSSGTILEMTGTLVNSHLDIKGSKVTKGDYLHLDHEVPAYEYTLRIVGELDQQANPPQLQGSASLAKSVRYRGDSGQIIRNVSIIGTPPNPIKGASYCGGSSCPACRRCDGDQCIADDSLPFNDGKFCTSCDGRNPGPDCCRGGRGLGTRIEDREVLTANVEQWDFAELARILKGAHEVAKFGGCELPPISITGGIQLTPVKQCCEEKKTFADGMKYGGTLSFEGLGVECPVPGLSVKIPEVAELGVEVGAALEGEASGSGTSGPCTDCGWSVDVKGGIVLSGKVVAKTTFDPSFLTIEAGVEGEGTVAGSCSCGGCGNFTACVGPLTIVGTATVAAWISKSIEIPIPNSQRCL